MSVEDSAVKKNKIKDACFRELELVDGLPADHFTLESLLADSIAGLSVSFFWFCR